MRTKKSNRKVINSRIERWKKEEYFNVGYTFKGDIATKEEEKLSELLNNTRLEYYKERGETQPKETISDWIKICKELIFNIINGKPLFHLIAYTYNLGRCEIQVSNIADILISEKTEEEKSDEIRSVLANAFVEEVPVIPNTKELIKVIAKYYRELMLEGFTAPDDSGNRIKLKLTNSPGYKIEKIDYIKEINLTEPHSPIELAILQESIIKELDRLSSVERIIGSLTIAIEQLSKLILIENLNENKLQKCLTENPILFGLDCTRIIPKHKLGSDYEMDYALERMSGLFDLVEIEPSNIPIFNKKGNPSERLVHAEQQVLNWLEWVEKNYHYAEEKLPGLIRQKGFVVIGKTSSLSKDEYLKLKRRNRIFLDSLEIITYDDLLNHAKNTEKVLLGQNNNI